MREIKFLVIFVIGILLFGTVAVTGINHKISNTKTTTIDGGSTDDFYFVHLTDTHTRHKIVDFSESTTKKLNAVLDKITSFENQPAFIVITGDLCEWGGSDSIGALNCEAFLSCFYEENDQLYADSELTIPVYTTPGNHDYRFSFNLVNYHKYIDKIHVEDEDRYIVTYGDVSLFFMDSGPDYYEDITKWDDVLGDGLYDDDIEWLEDAFSNCASPHKIVLMHYPTVNYRKDGEMYNVIYRNRLEFIELCETYEIDLVLAGHTHSAVVFDSNEEKYSDLPLNCSQYPTLYVQSDDCKDGIHYRNISIIGNDIILDSSVEVESAYYNLIKRHETLYCRYLEFLK